MAPPACRARPRPGDASDSLGRSAQLGTRGEWLETASVPADFDGIEVQIFDVTDLAEPKLQHKAVIGTRGSGFVWWSNSSSLVKRSIFLEDYAIGLSKDWLEASQLDNLDSVLRSLPLRDGNPDDDSTKTSENAVTTRHTWGLCAVFPV